MSTDTCQERVSDGTRFVTLHTCGRKLSGSDDYPDLCGLHAGVKRRAIEKPLRTSNRRTAVAAELAEFRARQAVVADALGLELTTDTRYPVIGPDAHTGLQATGKVLVDLVQLEKLVGHIRMLGQR